MQKRELTAAVDGDFKKTETKNVFEQAICLLMLHKNEVY